MSDLRRILDSVQELERRFDSVRARLDAGSLKEQARKLVTDLLYAQRNGHVKQEQVAYEKLRDWCQNNNVNMENAIAGVKKEKGSSVAAIMGGLV